MESAFVYDAPPEGEIRFEFSSDRYYREVLRCALCNHYISIHNMDMDSLYNDDYVSSTYVGDEGIRRNFEHINALDPATSDNTGRVRRVIDFADDYLTAPQKENRRPSVLDVGSGLCVFLHRMKAAGWECTALDTDQRYIRHAEEVVGVRTLSGDFLTLDDGVGPFDVISFNKVLEHVEDPVAMLAKSADYLHDRGFVYIELPDGECAAAGGPGREEFFIEHHHIFSSASAAMLAARAGFSPLMIERLREPSSKYTLRVFLIKV